MGLYRGIRQYSIHSVAASFKHAAHCDLELMVFYISLFLTDIRQLTVNSICMHNHVPYSCPTRVPTFFLYLVNVISCSD